MGDFVFRKSSIMNSSWDLFLLLGLLLLHGPIHCSIGVVLDGDLRSTERALLVHEGHLVVLDVHLHAFHMEDVAAIALELDNLAVWRKWRPTRRFEISPSHVSRIVGL